MNINKATIEELIDQLGLARTQAEKIITYRHKKGPFAAIEDTGRISRLSGKTLRAIEDKGKVKPIVRFSLSYFRKTLRHTSRRFTRWFEEVLKGGS